MLIFGQWQLRTILAQYEAHYNGRPPHGSRQIAPPRPPSRRPLPGADPASARPWWPHQRIPASRLKAQVRTGGRVVEPTGPRQESLRRLPGMTRLEIIIGRGEDRP